MDPQVVEERLHHPAALHHQLPQAAQAAKLHPPLLHGPARPWLSQEGEVKVVSPKPTAPQGSATNVD